MARGKRIVHLDLASDRPPDEDLLAMLLGRSGKLRAPAIRTGARLLVGYHPDLMATLLD